MKKYKNANGTGSITKVKINRTNPFRVRVTNPVTKKDILWDISALKRKQQKY